MNLFIDALIDTTKLLPLLAIIKREPKIIKVVPLMVDNGARLA